jgi:hypothetical protein
VITDKKMENVISPTIIYALGITCVIGLGYIYILYRSFRNRVSYFRTLKGAIYLVKNVVQYHEVYEKTVRWTDKLGYTKEENEMREQLFTILKNLKDDLGIKKNIKIR